MNVVLTLLVGIIAAAFLLFVIISIPCYLAFKITRVIKDNKKKGEDGGNE